MMVAYLKSPPIMASDTLDRLSFRKGQSLNVIIENFTSDLVAVSYSEGGRVFRGVLLREKERPFVTGVNEKRVLSACSWPPLLGSDVCVSLNTMPCLVERYTHKLDGQSSHLTIFRSDSKRGVSTNLSQHQYQRVVRQREFVCRKCKKSFHLDDQQPQSEPLKRTVTPRLREKSPTSSPLDSLQQSISPPLLISSKSESRLKAEVLNSEIDSSTDITPNRKRDRKINKKNRVVSKKRRVTDGESRPTSITPPDSVFHESFFPISNNISPGVNAIITPLELFTTQLPKDRIKAQYSSLNSSRLSPGRRPSYKSNKADKQLKVKPFEETDSLIDKCHQPLPLTSATTQEKSKSDEYSLLKVHSFSTVSNTFSILKPEDFKLEISSEVEKAPIISTLSLNNSNNPSHKLSNTVTTPLRRRSGCYEKPKNRWIRAERNRDTEEKRRKSVDTANTLTCNSPLPSSPAHLTDSELSNCVMADITTVEAGEIKMLLTDSSESPAALPPIKIKINRNVALGCTESNDSTAYQVVSKDVPVPILNYQSLSPKIPTKTESVERPQSVQSPFITTELPSATTPTSDKKATMTPPTNLNSNSEKCFVKRCQVADSSSTTVFRLGDVVWCKLAGWPSWPARITSLSREKDSSKDTVCTACVRWFAWDQVSYMACDKLWPFLTHYDRKLDKRKKRGAYKQAVEEALVAAYMQQEIQAEEDDGDSEDDGSGWVDETSNIPPPLASFGDETVKRSRGGRRGGPGRKPKQIQQSPIAVNSGSLPISSSTAENVVESTFSEDESEDEGQLIIDPGVPTPVSLINSYVLQLSNSHVSPSTSSMPTNGACIDRFHIPTAVHGNDTTPRT